MSIDRPITARIRSWPLEDAGLCRRRSPRASSTGRKADEDTVRDVIHAFNERGLAALDPRWAGGRPRLISDDDIAFIVTTATTRPRHAGVSRQGCKPRGDHDRPFGSTRRAGRAPPGPRTTPRLP